MDNKKVKVLDSRNISFSLGGNLLEVFDQKDQLVGDRTLPFTLPENIRDEAIYEYAEKKGININDLIAQIVDEAFFENKDYDVLLEENQMSFFSPAANQYVSEPYEGVFAWLEQHFAEVESEENKTALATQEDIVYVEEQVEDEEQEQAYEEQQNVVQEQPSVSTVQQLASAQSAVSVEPAEPAPVVSEPVVVHKPEPFQETVQSQPAPPVQVTKEESTVTTVQKAPETATIAPKPVVVTAPVSNHSEVLKGWLTAYRKVFTSDVTMNDVSLKGLKDIASAIVLDHINQNKNVFELNEKELLFELIEKEPMAFDAVTAIRAGLYEAYMFSQAEIG